MQFPKMFFFVGWKLPLGRTFPLLGQLRSAWSSAPPGVAYKNLMVETAPQKKTGDAVGAWKKFPAKNSHLKISCFCCFEIAVAWNMNFYETRHLKYHSFSALKKCKLNCNTKTEFTKFSKIQQTQISIKNPTSSHQCQGFGAAILFCHDFSFGFMTRCWRPWWSGQVLCKVVGAIPNVETHQSTKRWELSKDLCQISIYLL